MSGNGLRGAASLIRCHSLAGKRLFFEHAYTTLDDGAPVRRLRCYELRYVQQIAPQPGVDMLITGIQGFDRGTA